MQNATPIRYADPPSYVPGACNIGPFELARRRRSAVLAAIGTAVLAAALVALGAPPLVRALLVLPLWGTFVAVLQVRRRFCVAFAAGGVRNLAADGSGLARVDDAADRSADRRAALRMVLDALVLAVVATAVFVLLPL